MSTELTATAQVKADSRNQVPQLVLKIAGVDTVYGIGEVKKFIKIGDTGLEVGDEWKIGGLNAYEDQLDVINIEGSSNTISQQLLQDKGGTTSVPSIQISLMDDDLKITELITSGKVVEDLLGRKAEVYLGYQETAWPQDFVRIFSGIIDDITAGVNIVLNVAHPEQKKRVDVFQKITTELTADARFRSKTIQNITYQTRRDVVGTVTVTYTSGGVAGSEVVTVAGNNIVVQIAAGVSTASQVRNAIERSIDALALVTVKIKSGFTLSAQTVQALTNLDSDTTLNVKSTKGFLLPNLAEGFRTYVRINNEVIEYTSFTETAILGCTREALKTFDERAEGMHHETEDTVDTFYRLQGFAFDLALKVLMSGGPEYFATDIQIKSIVYVEGVGNIPNAVWFDGVNIQDAWGITVGDKVSIVDDQNAVNNVTGVLIADVVSTPYGSYIILDSTVSLVSSISSEGKISFASKWNVLPDGVQLGGDEVDVPEFERLRDIFSSSIFEYDFYLKETVTAKSFVDEEIMWPTGGFTLPRRGKISCGYTSPPLGSANLKVFDSTNTSKPDQNKIKRTINKFFYNNVLFQFNESVTDDLFLSGDLEVNQDSKNRIKVGNKTLLIKARGLRPSTDATTTIEILKKRFQDKFKFAAELVSTFAFYGKSFDSDVGDVVVFGDSTLKLPDTKSATRKFSPRLFEIQNKSLSIKTGEVKLDLLDSGYSLDAGRYGIISPSSLCVASGSTTSAIKIKNSYETVAPRLEKSKWTPYLNQKIIVHDEDFDFISETVFKGFSPSDDFLMLVEPPLSFVPSDNYIVDIAPYPDNANNEDNQLAKRVFVFTDPTVEVLSSLNTTSFMVSGLDVSKFLVGAVLIVRDTEWDIVSPEVKVLDVTGSTVTVDNDLGFTPLAGYEVDLIGFKDAGAPYRYL